MNILAVHPPYPGNKEIVYLPLGLGYIAAVAEREGHDVTVFDTVLAVPAGGSRPGRA